MKLSQCDPLSVSVFLLSRNQIVKEIELVLVVEVELLTKIFNFPHTRILFPTFNFDISKLLPNYLTPLLS